MACTVQHSDRIAALERLRGSEAVPDEYVRLRVDVLRVQIAALEALGCTSSAPVPPRLPVTSADIAFAPALLRDMLAGMLTALRDLGTASDSVARLTEAVQAAPELIADVARHAAFDSDERFLSDTAGELRISPSALLWVGRILAAPFVTHAVRASFGEEPAEHPTGPCPFCGSTPGLAWLRRADGRRTLCCSLCGGLWLSARLQCPFCGDARQWNRLVAAETDPRWIEACGACRLYLKVSDERKLPESATVVPLVESAATLDLDIIAEHHGWCTAAPYAALR